MLRSSHNASLADSKKKKKNLLLSVYSLFASLLSLLFNARIAIHSLSCEYLSTSLCSPTTHVPTRIPRLSKVALPKDTLQILELITRKILCSR